MQPFEMQGLLAGKCLPGDMLVGESLAKYLLRKINQRDELARQVSALQTSQDNIINGLGIKGDGPYSKLVLEKFFALQAERDALTAENVDLKNSREVLANNALETCNDVYSAGYRNTALHDGLMESTGDRNRYPHPIKTLVSEATRTIETPATDAAIAEIKASELDDLAISIMEYAPVIESDEYHVYEVIAKDVTDRAANLRAGRKG